MLMMDFIDLGSLYLFIIAIGSLLFIALAYVFLINYILNLEKDMLRNRKLARASVMLLDQDVLECPICCEPLKIPIYQCINGHLACTPCWKKVKSICPFCLKPAKYDFRCRAMEKVIEAAMVSCPNASYGCKKYVSYTNLSSHEKQCRFAQCSCPMRNWNYTGSSKDLSKHVRANHRNGRQGKFRK
ncbi:unnamed protein product [Arabidopsis lyrata]|uniref:RING-type E3 ubiquitin transferase n=1 Tax=Arabidopsis lyrata subsp. lyrata TaxID=81972 RepID=D7MK57_ARALL|nr:hypothetical protein ARALYDRAFT_916568 [Arabidopsis lyrata subsp. lyrata]CAH8277355.1 unnamed protein product [Arabidopsis lyrata]